MSWNSIDLSTVNPNLEIIPVKSYTWELLPGTKYSERDPGKIEVSAAIVNDGEFTGRRIFFSYPDPGVKEWSPKVLRRLLDAMGADYQAGEDPVAILNSSAGHRFAASVTHSKPTEEYPNPRANLDIFNPKPSV